MLVSGNTDGKADRAVDVSGTNIQILVENKTNVTIGKWPTYLCRIPKYCLRKCKEICPLPQKGGRMNDHEMPEGGKGEKEKESRGEKEKGKVLDSIKIPACSEPPTSMTLAQV